jgi:preprotein translocase subunit YajC
MHRIVLLLSAVALVLAEEGGPNPGAVPAGAPAGGPAGAQAQGPLGGFGFLIFILLMFAMMWFMVIRPQRKEEKRRKEMVDAIKRGDEVVTIGGVHGVVEAVGEGTIDVRIGKGSESVVATFNKGAVSTNLTAEKANAKK